jgi:hypothetical protein
LRYQEINPVTKAAATEALARNDPRELSLVVLGLALHERDASFAQDFCAGLATHLEPNVRGNAILGFAHIARRHGSLDLATVLPLVRAALCDVDLYVRGHAESTADDIETFLDIPVR